MGEMEYSVFRFTQFFNFEYHRHQVIHTTDNIRKNLFYLREIFLKHSKQNIFLDIHRPMVFIIPHMPCTQPRNREDGMVHHTRGGIFPLADRRR